MKKIKQILSRKLFKFILIFLCICLAVILFFRKEPSGVVNSAEDIQWGVVFSKRFAADMGLDWRETYLAILDDLKVKAIRLPVYWQDVEPKEGEYIFSDYDWMIKEAENRNVKLTLAIGRKTPRWPECNIPDWAGSLADAEQQDKVLELVPKIVERYKNSKSLYAWQVENEPFLNFGICPKSSAELLDKEIALVRRLDPAHLIEVTDSGELSTWIKAAKRADIFGTTLYRVIYKEPLGYITYPMSANFFWKKANLVHLLYPNKPMIISELQAEPWCPGSVRDMSLEEQFKSMDINQFRQNIGYAEKIRFPEVYFWGAEWWYWMKTQKNHPEFWEEAKQKISPPLEGGVGGGSS